jgi:hypothetical protein
MSEEKLERLINSPKEFIVNGKKVTVESHPPGAVTMIIKKLVEKMQKIDLAIVKEKLQDAEAETFYDLFYERLDKAEEYDLEIFQLMLTPAAKWREKKGVFTEKDFPISIDELQWDTNESTLGEIFDEWAARNPRFAIQKKMANIAITNQ